MPKTLRERVIYLFCMACMMVYGMEVYNKAILHGSMDNSLFFIPIGTFFSLVAIVMILQEFVGGPLARKMASRVVDASTDREIAVIVTIQVMTVLVMCPSMSMVATLLFKGIDSQIPAKWVQTLVMNFPMAFFWQIMIAGPVVRMIVRKLFAKPA